MTQTDHFGSQVDQLTKENKRLFTENQELRKLIERMTFTEETFNGNDLKVKYYTGLPNYETLNALALYVKGFIPPTSVENGFSLTNFQQLVIFLMKLQSTTAEEIKQRFMCSHGSVFVLFFKLLDIFFTGLGPSLVCWPEKDTNSDGNQTTIGFKILLEILEISINKPAFKRGLVETWSEDRQEHTLKCVLGITPQGTIIYVSQLYGGACSDDFIVQSCGVLEKFTYGDSVISSTPLVISRILAGKGATYTTNDGWAYGKSVVNQLCKKFPVLSTPFHPKQLKNNQDGTQIAKKIVHVCCSLFNLCPSNLRSQKDNTTHVVKLS